MGSTQPIRLANCQNCGKLYVRSQHRLCPACIQAREEQFQRCRTYLREHPETRMNELSERTGVKVEQIIGFIAEGRIILTKDNPHLFYHCSRCGSPIRSGRLCPACEKTFNAEVQSLVQKSHTDGPPKGKISHNYRIYNRDD